jgi:hypothetical protein
MNGSSPPFPLHTYLYVMGQVFFTDIPVSVHRVHSTTFTAAVLMLALL